MNLRYSRGDALAVAIFAERSTREGPCGCTGHAHKSDALHHVASSLGTPALYAYRHLCHQVVQCDGGRVAAQRRILAIEVVVLLVVTAVRSGNSSVNTPSVSSEVYG